MIYEIMNFSPIEQKINIFLYTGLVQKKLATSKINV